MKCGIGLVKLRAKANNLALVAAIALVVVGCKTGTKEAEAFDWQGHRGARGEAPENTTAAMLRALQEGVKTLEMDVVLSADSVVLLSHEPWFNPEICLDFQGLEWSDSADRNIFHYSYDAIAKCDCGTKPYARFPNQEHFKAAKPRLLDVISEMEEASLMMNRPEPYYNIEIKARPEWDGVYYPNVEFYCDMVLELLSKANLGDRLMIQSFDPRVLQYLHNQFPQLALAYLTEDGTRTAAQQIADLGFVPQVYSCDHQLLDEMTVKSLQTSGMKVVPWTVNEIERAQELRAWKVDGIITDYPALMIATLGN